MSHLNPVHFFSPLPHQHQLADDVQRIESQVNKLLQDTSPTQPDSFESVPLNILFGPKHSGKSRLLLQLAYQLASRELGATDPHQPVVLILPKKRALTLPPTSTDIRGTTTSNMTGSGSKSLHHPLIGLFGVDHLKMEVLSKIRIKWYADDAELVRIVSHAHFYSSESESSGGVPPRFLGLMYDHGTGTSEAGGLAARMALILGRLSEALATIRVGNQPYEPCQSLFVVSSDPAVPRLQALLPRYARVLFEVTPNLGGSSVASSWLLHTRPNLTPIATPLTTLNQLLVPMAGLMNPTKPTPAPIITSTTASTSSSGLAPDGSKISPRSLPLSELPGIPVLIYQITPDSLQMTGFQIQEK